MEFDEKVKWLQLVRHDDQFMQNSRPEYHFEEIVCPEKIEKSDKLATRINGTHNGYCGFNINIGESGRSFLIVSGGIHHGLYLKEWLAKNEAKFITIVEENKKIIGVFSRTHLHLYVIGQNRNVAMGGVKIDPRVVDILFVLNELKGYSQLSLRVWEDLEEIFTQFCKKSKHVKNAVDLSITSGGPQLDREVEYNKVIIEEVNEIKTIISRYSDLMDKRKQATDLENRINKQQEAIIFEKQRQQFLMKVGGACSLLFIIITALFLYHYKYIPTL